MSDKNVAEDAVVVKEEQIDKEENGTDETYTTFKKVSIEKWMESNPVKKEVDVIESRDITEIVSKNTESMSDEDIDGNTSLDLSRDTKSNVIKLRSSVELKKKLEKSMSNASYDENNLTNDGTISPDHNYFKNELLSSVNMIKKDAKGRTVDPFCWKCHKQNTHISCSKCPRTFHTKCASVKLYDSIDWICNDCKISKKSFIPKERCIWMNNNKIKICELLKYSLNRLIDIKDVHPFLDHVDTVENPDYLRYIIKPMCLYEMRDKVEKELYNSTNEFESDCQWIIHNSIIFNSVHSSLTSMARYILKVCKEETKEINMCPQCYKNANTIGKNWFLEACEPPHILLWAKLKGFRHWPAKGIHVNDDETVYVKFFGDHDRSRLPVKSCLLYSKQCPSKNKPTDLFLSSMEELNKHIKNITEKYGEIVISLDAALYKPEENQINMMIPKLAVLKDTTREVDSNKNKVPKLAALEDITQEVTSINTKEVEDIISNSKLQPKVVLTDFKKISDGVPKSLSNLNMVKVRKITPVPNSNLLTLKRKSIDSNHTDLIKKPLTIPIAKEPNETLLNSVNKKVNSPNLFLPIKICSDKIAPSKTKENLTNIENTLNKQFSGSVTIKKVVLVDQEKSRSKINDSSFPEVKTATSDVISLKSIPISNKHLHNQPTKIVENQEKTIPQPDTDDIQSNTSYEVENFDKMDIEEDVHKLAKKIASNLTETSNSFILNICKTVIKSVKDDISINSNEADVEKLKTQHACDMNELEHIFNTSLLEICHFIERDREGQVSITKKSAEKERKNLKFKHWCVNCENEALYFCCWKASYCSENCQRKDWISHYSSCCSDLFRPQTKKESSSVQPNIKFLPNLISRPSNV